MKNILLNILELQDQIINNKKVILNDSNKLNKNILDDPDLFLNELIEIKGGEEIPIENIYILNLSMLSIDWDLPQEFDQNDYLYGGFKFNSIVEAFSGESTFWKIYDNDINIDLKKLNYFQMSGHGHDGTFGCILREKNKWPLDIYFYDNGQSFKTDFTFKTYVKAMIESCAVQNWQYFYIDLNPNHPKINAIISKMEYVVKNIGFAFPEKDFSFHKKKLDDLKSKI